jgi:hypothetical protein
MACARAFDRSPVLFLFLFDLHCGGGQVNVTTTLKRFKDYPSNHLAGLSIHNGKASSDRECMIIKALLIVEYL